MARDYPDRFAPEPVDRIASQVVSSGYHFEPTVPPSNREIWDTPPEVVPTVYVPTPIRELIGQRKGRMVIIGYLGRRYSQFGTKKGQILLVRCDCGKYEERVARKWRKNHGLTNRCQVCDVKERLKVQHLSHAEKDALENRERKRRGLPTKQQELIAKLDEKLIRRLVATRLGRF